MVYTIRLFYYTYYAKCIVTFCHVECSAAKSRHLDLSTSVEMTFSTSVEMTSSYPTTQQNS